MSEVRGRVVRAAGTLAATPLAHALVYLRNKKLTGALELCAPTGRQARIDLHRGAATYASTTPAVARFGSVAYELGLIDAEQLDALCIESNAKQTPEAELLVSAGSITFSQREKATVEQIRRRILHAFTFPPETRFAFAEAKTGESPPKLTVDILAPIWRGVLAFPPEHEIELVLGRFGETIFRLVGESALEHADLDPRERAVVEGLARRPMSVPELVRSHPLPHGRTRLLAYFLVIAKCVEPHAVPRSGTIATPREAGNAPSVEDDGTEPRSYSFQLSCLKIRAATVRAPASISAVLVTPADLGVEGIRHRAAALSSETAYETLGLPEGASLEAARAAYYRLARVWHPDRLPSHLAMVLDETTKIFLQMTDAYRSIAAVEVAGR